MKTLLLAFVAFIFVACDNTEYRSGFDENGLATYYVIVGTNKKHGTYKVNSGDVLIIKTKYKDGKLHGKYQKWYSNGNPEIETTYKDGNIDGEYKEYCKNGTLGIKATYDDGKKAGEYKSYYCDGSPYIEARYKDGKLNGKYIVYDKYGGVEQELNYKDGKKDGISKKYQRIKNSSGEYEYKPLKEESYKNDILDGITKEYYGGILISEISYKNGEKYGITKRYSDDDGMLIEEIPYKNKSNIIVYEGIYKSWHKNGQLGEESEWVDNKKIKGKEYYENGNLKYDFQKGKYSKEYYENGKLQKETIMDGENEIKKAWRDNGNLEYERHYKRVNRELKQHGVQKEYSSDGMLIKENNYDNDKLVGWQYYYHDYGDHKGKLYRKCFHEKEYNYAKSCKRYHEDGSLASEYDNFDFERPKEYEKGKKWDK